MRSTVDRFTNAPKSGKKHQYPPLIPTVPVDSSMLRDHFTEEEPDPQTVLDALGDQKCRAIIKALTEPMTAKELSEACGMPLSTCYRKLELLDEASLLESRVDVYAEGKKTNYYVLAFDNVRFDLDDDRSIEVSVNGHGDAPEDRLTTLWSEVRKET